MPEGFRSNLPRIPKAPLVKGGKAGGARREDSVKYKHNPRLTDNAKILRKSMTKEERHLWYDFLRNYPVRFLRQKVIGNHIVDFYCANAKLVIELDGSQHYEKTGLLQDKIRTKQIEEYGLTVVRIQNNEVLSNFIGVCEYIDSLVKKSLRQAAPAASL